MLRSCLTVCLAGIVVMWCGCAPRSPYTVVPIEGTLVYEGKPLEGFIVEFRPEAGRPSSGVTDKDGKFSLVYTASQDGVQVGVSTVKITWRTGNQPPPPEQYNDMLKKFGYHSEGFKYEVTKPNKKLVLDLDKL